MKHNLILLILVIFVADMISQRLTPFDYTLVYHQSADGKALAGSVKELTDAVRAGRSIRLYMQLSTVEHSMDSGFVSVFNGEVFAQTSKIQAQQLNHNAGVIELNEKRTHIGLYSTQSPYEIKWYAN